MYACMYVCMHVCMYVTYTRAYSDTQVHAITQGWDVNEGPPKSEPFLKPSMLISLTAPKNCAQHFNGAHYVGGRFVPPNIAQKYELSLPPYPGELLCVYS
jgi:hypothetical protein